MVDLHATDRRDSEDMLPVRAEAAEPALERVAQATGQGKARMSGRHQLFGEERVAARPREDRLDEVSRNRLAGDAGELGGHLVGPERRELEVIDLIEALELGKQREEGVSPVQLVGPIGRDDEQAGAARVSGEEADEVAARRIGPVDVLEDEDERSFVRETKEELEHNLEEAGLVGGRGQRPVALDTSLGRGEVRHEMRELDASGAKELVQPLRRQ